MPVTIVMVLGKVHEINLDKMIPDRQLSIKNGGLAPLGEEKKSWIFKQLGHIADKFGFSFSDPIAKIPKEAMELILYGGKEKLEINSKELGVSRKYEIDFEGISNFILNQYNESHSTSIKTMGQRDLWTKLIVPSVEAKD